MKSSFIVFLIIFFSSCGFVYSQLDTGLNQEGGLIISLTKAEIPINYSTINVNNSIYWDGNAWSDVRWLDIDGSNANTNIDIGSYDFTTSGDIKGFAHLQSAGSTASGAFSTALGDNTTASNYASFAAGEESEASGSGSFAVGETTIASGGYSAAFGSRSEATGDYSFAAGDYAQAMGADSTAMGEDVTASGYGSVAMGGNTNAEGDYSLSTGFYTTANGSYSSAFGFFSRAENDFSVAMGNKTNATGSNAFAFGSNFENSLSDSFAVGFGDNTLRIVDNNVSISGDLTIEDDLTVKGEGFFADALHAQDSLITPIIGITNYIKMQDNDYAYFGSAEDAKIYYDTTNLIINPKNVGSGYLKVEGDTYHNGNVGIGIAPSSSYQLQVYDSSIDSSKVGTRFYNKHQMTDGYVYGIQSVVYADPAASSSAQTRAAVFTSQSLGANDHTGVVEGIWGYGLHNGIGTASDVYGLRFSSYNYNTGTITNARACDLQIINQVAGGTITDGTALYIKAPSNAGTITNDYGIYIEEQTEGATINNEIFIGGAGEIFFRDQDIHIGSLTDGHLDLTADSSIDLNQYTELNEGDWLQIGTPGSSPTTSGIAFGDYDGASADTAYVRIEEVIDDHLTLYGSSGIDITTPLGIVNIDSNLNVTDNITAKNFNYKETKWKNGLMNYRVSTSSISHFPFTEGNYAYGSNHSDGTNDYRIGEMIVPMDAKDSGTIKYYMEFRGDSDVAVGDNEIIYARCSRGGTQNGNLLDYTTYHTYNLSAHSPTGYTKGDRVDWNVCNDTGMYPDDRVTILIYRYGTDASDTYDGNIYVYWHIKYKYESEEA